MQTRDFLFELGVEEIPAGYILAAITGIEDNFKRILAEKKLHFTRLKTYSTPRRLAVSISGLPIKQDEEIIEKIGPARSVVYTADGSLTKAALGFIQGAQANPADIYFVDTPKGEKIAVKKEMPGRQTGEIIKEIITEIVSELPFPKSMKWGSCPLFFARPIRWLVVMFGNEIIGMEIAGIPADKISYGNRFQKLENPVIIDKIENYEAKLESVFVIADRDKRRKLISEQVEKLFAGSEERIIQDDNLLETVTNLVEYPTAVLAAFDRKYLKLPEKVITSTLSQHQRYFAVQDNKGKITSKFVFLSNGDSRFSELIKKGNEKVITARLEDAGFYFREDTEVPLENFVPKLAEVTFQENLGTLLEKTERLEKIADFISRHKTSDENVIFTAKRAAFLCKADLVTQMLGEKEFTRLQGYMGREYALQSGESREVAEAVYEHYLPRGERDKLPVTTVGAIVAIADKIDTVCGIIGVNMLPTGSKDPFALRRAANGIVQIIDKFQFEINLQELVLFTFSVLQSKLPRPENNLDFVLDFFKQRVEWLLKQKKIEYDVIESVMHIDHNNIPDLTHRAAALQNFKQRSDFIRLVLAFKRVSNIIAEAGSLSEVNPDLLHEAAEKNLHAEYQLLAESISRMLPTKSYEKILEKLIDFGGTIDRFFDEVLVNTDLETLRYNRYNLLFQIRLLFLRVADISKIVVENDR